MSKKDTVKTCIGLKSENMKLLNKWHTETGLSKGELIDLLIENAAKNKVQLQVTYKLGE